MAGGERGFTLIELVIVIVTIGLLSWVAFPKSYVTDTRIGVAARKIQSDIRYAQELAMTRGEAHQIRFFSATNSYDIVTASSNPVPDPLTRDESYVVDFNSGTFSGVQLDTTITVEFDSLGRPDAAKTITLNGGSKVITVTAETGRVVL